MIESMLTECAVSDNAIQGVYMSGMLTSDLGILEVPHLTAPVCMKNYQEHLIRVHLPEVFSKEIVLIPGIKIHFPMLNLLIRCADLTLCEAKKQKPML